MKSEWFIVVMKKGKLKNNIVKNVNQKYDKTKNRRVKKMSENWLVCGTRKWGYADLVFDGLNKIVSDKQAFMPQGVEEFKPDSIIEGCCPDSADEYAEQWAINNGILLSHHPSISGNYLKRNIEMVKKADFVIAFWDGRSYGTAQTIAQATMRRIPIKVIFINARKQVGEK